MAISQSANYHKKPYNRFYKAPKGPRKNEGIRANEVRVIGPDNQQVGVISTREAISMARNYGLDLVEIAPNAAPPVCKITDFGKYMYEESKQKKDNKSHTQKEKQVKLGPNIGPHDYQTKLRHAEDFLNKSCKLKITLEFRGRDQQKPRDVALGLMLKIANDLNHIGTLDAPPSYAGRNVTAMFSPLPANKRKLRFAAECEECHVFLIASV